MQPTLDGMNYYRRYVGDFQADTMQLSMMEQGAYDRLLDHYYATEKPIPIHADRAAIICRAITMEERAAVEMVLHTYFERREDGWFHKRVQKEIAVAQARSRTASEAGKLGADSRWHGNEDGNSHSNSHSKGDGNRDNSPTTNHQPNTKTKHTSAVADYAGAFVAFWDAWPKSKRKLGKFASYKLWGCMNLEPLAEAIIAHVEAMKKSQQWRDGYDPKPETYLRNRRWEDGAPEVARPRLVI